MNRTTLAIVVAVSASIALADDFKTIDGTEYKHVTINRVESDGIVITHSSGVTKIPFTELAKDVQERFGYDAAKIEAENAAAKTAEHKRIEEQKAAERERAEKEKNAEADLSRSQEQFRATEQRALQTYKSSPKGTLSGQVFVATKSGENFKLGAVQVSLFARDAIDVLLARLKAFAYAKIEQLQPQLDTAETAHKQAEATEQQAETTALKQSKAALEQSKAWTLQTRAKFAELAKAAMEQDAAKEKIDWEAAKESADAAAKESANAGEEATNAVKAAWQGVNLAKEAANAASQRYNELLQQKASYYSAAFYFSHLGSPIQTAETDADGKFVIEVPQTGAFVIAVQSKRGVGEDTEGYYWLQPVSLEGRQQRVQNLSNNNLTRTTETSSLINTGD